LAPPGIWTARRKVFSSESAVANQARLCNGGLAVSRSVKKAQEWVNFFSIHSLKQDAYLKKLTLNASVCDGIAGCYAVSGDVGEDVQV
jgi:hypothetical protein